MARSTTVSPEAEAILTKIDKNVQALRRSEPYARSNLLDTARSLIAELENPGETISRIAWAEVCFCSPLHMAG